jgi:hypothetical protein
MHLQACCLFFLKQANTVTNAFMSNLDQCLFSLQLIPSLGLLEYQGCAFLQMAAICSKRLKLFLCCKYVSNKSRPSYSHFCSIPEEEQVSNPTPQNQQKEATFAYAKKEEASVPSRHIHTKDLAG